MNIKIDWNILSRQRSSLMGVAILFIMMFHSSNVLNEPIMDGLFHNGDIGVEFFTILSAVGVCRSFGNNSSIKHFYLKRFKRIIPLFLIVIIPYSLFLHFRYGASWGHVAVMVSGLSIFRDDISFWYVPFILICYLITPFLIHIREKIRFPFVLTIIISILVIAIYFVLNGSLSKSCVWLPRFASFALGVDMAGNILAPTCIKHRNCGLAILIFLILGLLVRATGCFPLKFAKYFIYMVLSLPFMVSIAFLLESSVFVRRIFSFLGGITLELYLIHERISLPIVQSFVSNSWAAALISILLATTIGTILSKTMSRII